MGLFDLAGGRLEAQVELLLLELQKLVGQLEKTHRVEEVRRDIARIKTVLRAKAPTA